MAKEDGGKEEDPKDMSDSERPKVYAMGLPHEISESAVKTFFSSYGKVTDVVFKTSGDGRVLRGLAYIYFESQESVDKLLEKKLVTIEDKKVHVKKALEEIVQEGEKPELEIPLQALKCIVCKHNKFSSVSSYLNHRKGRHHQAVLKIYRSKSASVRQLLKAEATLSVERQYNIAWMTKHPSFNHFCEICKCQIYCDPEKHNMSNAHKLLKNYDVQKCCDIEFTERKKYENHLLSLSHLKKAYAKEQLNKTNGDIIYGFTMKKAIEVFKQCESDLKELKETYGELDLNEEIPPFDKEKPIGLNFIVKKINYHCLCCDQKFFANKRIVEPHCCSYQHFCNMQDHIVEVEKAQYAKRRREAQESAKGGEPKEDAKKEGEAGKRKNEEPYKPNKKKAAADGKDSDDKDKEGAASEDDKSEDARDENAAEESEGEQHYADEMDTLEKSDFNEDEEEYAQGDEDEYEQDEEENVQDEDIDETMEAGEPIEDQEPDEIQEVQDDDDEEEIKEPQDDDIEEIPVIKSNKQIEVVDINDDASEVETPAKDEAKEEEQEEEPKRPQKAIRGRRGRGRGRGARK